MESKLETVIVDEIPTTHTNRLACCCCRKRDVLPANASLLQKLLFACSCPPFGCVGRILARLFWLACTWALLLTTVDYDALPGGKTFSLLVTFVICYIGGALAKLCRLPSLLGTSGYIFSINVCLERFFGACSLANQKASS
jgi:hypothetical protein